MGLSSEMRLSSNIGWFSVMGLSSERGCPLNEVVLWMVLSSERWLSSERGCQLEYYFCCLLDSHLRWDSLTFIYLSETWFTQICNKSTSMYFVQDSNVWKCPIATPRIQSTQVWILDLGISPVRSTVFAIHSVSETNIRIHGERVIHRYRRSSKWWRLIVYFSLFKM